jgi:hypothetical protein
LGINNPVEFLSLVQSGKHADNVAFQIGFGAEQLQREGLDTHLSTKQ